MTAKALVAPLVAVLLSSAVGQIQAAPPQSSDEVVKVFGTAYPADESGKQQIEITLYVAQDWHVYANPVGNKSLEASQTTVTATATPGVVPLTVRYPAGKLVKDDGEEYRTYEGTEIIRATAERVTGDKSPLQVQVRVWACSDKYKKCLAPGTVTVTLP